MIQLAYHPAYDPYNTLLRSARILSAIPDGVERTALRILDFFLLFPENLTQARLSPAVRSAVRRLGSAPRFPYDRLPAAKSVYDRMEPTFEAAIQTMISRGLAILDDQNVLKASPSSFPIELAQLVQARNEQESALISILKSLAEEFETNGLNGLKDRSGLAEYRYDAV